MLGQLILVTTILLSAAEARPGEQSFRVIVNRSNTVTSLRRAEVSAIFMRREKRWPDGSGMIPVDQSPTADVREVFSRSTHGKSVAYVIRYWHRLIFAGRALPPIEAASDEAVIELVRKNRGAIGYVGSQTRLPDEVRVIPVMQ